MFYFQRKTVGFRRGLRRRIWGPTLCCTATRNRKAIT